MYMSEGRRILKVSNLSVHAGGQKILDNVSFDIDRGSALAIVGPNGAGKTTLFKALMRLMPYTGNVEWTRKVRIGYVPQSFSVSDIPVSVREFLSFKSRSTDPRKSLESVGLDISVSEKRLDVLSGGEMQRVLVAWAMLEDPDVLLLDEPTTGVDIGSEEHIYEMVERLREERGITVLLISHDIHTVHHYSDYMLALNRRAIFFGRSEKILEPKLLNDIYGSATILRKHTKR